MKRRIFVDTEWTAPPWAESSELMWVGLADEAGHSWYGISSEAVIDPLNNQFVSGAFNLINPNEPRMSRAQLAREIQDFCGKVDEFWAWIPTVASFTEWFELGEQGLERFKEFWDVDLQMMRLLFNPWPVGWPDRLHNLNSAATLSRVELPPRATKHLHPRVHAEWNRQLFERIRTADRLET